MLWSTHKIKDNQRTTKENPKAIFFAAKGFEAPISITRKMDIIKTTLITRTIYSIGNPPKDQRMEEQSVNKARLNGK